MLPVLMSPCAATCAPASTRTAASPSPPPPGPAGKPPSPWMPLCQRLPKPPRCVRSDNGSALTRRCQEHLKEHAISHWWTCPQSPNMSAHAERFNRTLQEQFADCHEALLFSDLAENRKLAAWLLDYNKSCPITASACNLL